jgi:anti-sigma B factor antagonist
MEFKLRTAEAVAVLEFSGRLDAYESPRVAEWLDKAMSREAPRLVVNLAGVNFIDSTGLAKLVQAMKRCRQSGGDLHLSALQQPVRIIFELTRLDKAFQVFATEEDAIAAFGA